MARGPESQLQAKIQKALRREFPNSLFFKTYGSPFQRKGLPDIIGCVNGFFIGIEVKVPGRENTLTELQKDTLDEIQKAGGIAFMTTSVEHAVRSLKLELEQKKFEIS